MAFVGFNAAFTFFLTQQGLQTASTLLMVNPIQSNPTQPNPTQPNPTQPNPTQPNPTQPGKIALLSLGVRVCASQNILNGSCSEIRLSRGSLLFGVVGNEKNCIAFVVCYNFVN